MKVVLLENIDNLGIVGDIKEVADGFARNYLLPQNLVVKVGDTKAKALLKNIAKKREEIKSQIISLKEVAKKYDAKEIDIQAKANQKGVLFKSVTKNEIAKKIGVDAKLLSLDPIKEVGKHNIEINFGNNIKAKVLLNIINK